MALFMSRRRPNLWKDVLLGAIAGGVGTAIMGPVMTRLQKMERPAAKAREKVLGPSEPAVEQVAQKGAELVGQRLAGEPKKVAGQAVHWSYGVLWGAVLGAVHDRIPIPAVLEGLLFGAAVGVFGEALLLPALKLTAPPQKYPVDTHLASLAAHLVYGAGVERSFHWMKRALA